MSVLQAVILGFIQGITEFLPISSSAHLVLFPYFMNWGLNDELIFVFDVLVQLGTLLAIVFYYRKDLLDISRHILEDLKSRKFFQSHQSKVGWYALFATIPAVAVGVFTKRQIETAFRSPLLSAIFLLITAALLILAEKIGKRSKNVEHLTLLDALWIGMFQVLALFPGISRSGSTIAGAMTRDMKRKDAGNFSFLMAIPIMAAASIVGLIDLLKLPSAPDYFPTILIGGLTAALVGFATIRLLIQFLNKYSLYPFSIYCAALSIFTLASIFISFSEISFPTISSKDQQINTTMIEVDPEMEWMLPMINNCISGNASPILQTSKSPDEEPSTEYLYFSLGEQTISGKSVFRIGEENIILITNQASPIITLEFDHMKDIFSGRVKTWENLSERCEECVNLSRIDPSRLIKIYVYPSGSQLENAIHEFFGLNKFSASAAELPNSKTMLVEIGKNTDGVALIPERWVGESQRSFDVVDDNNQRLILSILAYLNKNDVEYHQETLYCIQQTLSE